MIHPSALVDPAAELAADVEVGPYAIIEGPAEIGAGCRIEAGAQIVGRVRIGARSSVGRAAIIGGDPQDIAFDPRTPSGVILGEDTVIREHVTVHRSTRPDENTVVGSGNFLMATSHLGHDVFIGDNNVVANACLLAGFVRVGSRSFLGGGSVFHQFIRVGDGAMVQGNSAMSRDVPPFSIVQKVNQLKGLNVVGLRRGGFSAGERAELKRLYTLLFGSGRNLSQAIAEAAKHDWSPRVHPLLDFVRGQSHKGICLP